MKKRATEWGVKKCEKWYAKRKLIVDFKTENVTEILRNFFAEMKTDDSMESALAGVRAV